MYFPVRIHKKRNGAGLFEEFSEFEEIGADKVFTGLVRRIQMEA
jgi:hypothetical protein